MLIKSANSRVNQFNKNNNNFKPAFKAARVTCNPDKKPELDGFRTGLEQEGFKITEEITTGREIGFVYEQEVPGVNNKKPKIQDVLLTNRVTKLTKAINNESRVAKIMRDEGLRVEEDITDRRAELNRLIELKNEMEDPLLRENKAMNAIRNRDNGQSIISQKKLPKPSYKQSS